MIKELEIYSEKCADGVERVVLPRPDHFDIEKIFDCGQCFRFDRVETSVHECEYSGVAFGRFVSFAQDGDTIYIYNSDEKEFEEIWSDFLCLDMDYSAIDGDILANCGGIVMENAAREGRGIRILRQDPFESVISFIISQNNNIPRIKKIIESLCARLGERIDTSGLEAHLSGRSSLCSFPDVRAIHELGVDGLYELRTGFRAKYIFDCVEKIMSGELDLAQVAELESTDHAIEELCRVKGIGVKVASCALLFGFGRYDAFPVDVWMKRAVEKYFPEYSESLKRGDFSPSVFGRYAGIAQQYLFYYERYQGGE